MIRRPVRVVGPMTTKHDRNAKAARALAFRFSKAEVNHFTTLCDPIV
jgi:hypothetical protein